MVSWAKQGVLLLNTVLTVRGREAASHKRKGWEIFTNAVIRELNKREEPIVFVLWGKHAQDKKKLITEKHIIIESAHPSPLSAHRGFLGSKPFSKINEHLNKVGHPIIKWDLS